jgi:hypothetical protein
MSRFDIKIVESVTQPAVNHISLCHAVLRIRDLALFDPWIRDPDPDPGWKKSGSGIKISGRISESLVILM